MACVRNWLHADDTAEAVLTLIEKGREGEIYNVAGGFEQTAGFATPFQLDIDPYGKLNTGTLGGIQMLSYVAFQHLSSSQSYLVGSLKPCISLQKFHPLLCKRGMEQVLLCPQLI